MMETLSTDANREPELTDAEQAAVARFEDWYKTKKQEKPEVSEDDFHKTIVSGLGGSLGIPGYRFGDSEDPSAKPTEEQQARLEELYGMVVGSSENVTGWENMAEQVEELKKPELTDAEQAAVARFEDWYKTKKQEKPEVSEDDFHKTIVSGLGGSLGIPGYRFGDSEDPSAKPTEEQQARLEELYGMVVGSLEGEHKKYEIVWR